MERDYDKVIDKEVKVIDKWIAYFSRLKYIKSVVYVLALLETTISPLLPELVVAAILTYRKDLSWKIMSAVSALGSATGAGILYFLGKFLYREHTAFFEKILGSHIGSYGERLLEHNTFVSVFVAALTPLPDRVFAFLSGVFSLSFIVVFIAFFLGRLIRVGIVAYFSYEYGDEARVYILKHTRGVTIFVVVAILLYALYVFM